MSNEAPTDALRLVPDEEQIFAWLNRKYVQRADERQRSMNLQYMEAETHDLSASLHRWLLAAAPASPLPGGGPHERWSILNHLGESWTPENFDTERQATAFLDRWKRDNPKMDLSKHKVIPVLVTMTAAPTGGPK